MITKKTTDYNFDFLNGEILLIDKPKGWTSFKVVHKIRSSVNIKKVGHSGTLDPMATGLLIVCTGKKTREISFFQNLPKTYEGIITLGKTTPSMDAETKVVEEKPVDDVTEVRIFKAKEKFTGRIKQIPPMYSAKKVKGKPLYKIARKGKVIEREPVEVEIYDFSINKIRLPDIWFKIKCSRGTYIRAIADDLGKELGCGGFLSELRRTAIGEFTVKDALKPGEFVQMMSVSSGQP
jgi:tRNA pseudouridine55 synthase